MENTPPPDTVAVRKNLAGYRTALEDLQTAYTKNVETPEFSKTVSFNLHDCRPASADSAAAEGRETLADVVLYTNPALSFLFVIVGVVGLAVTRYMAVAREWTALSAVCYLLLAELAVNFLRSLLSASPDSGNWQNSSLASSAVRAATRAVDLAAALHDRVLTARDPGLSLKVAAGLWTLAWAGKYLSVWTLAVLVFATAFTVPIAVHTHRATLVAVYADATSAAKARWAGLGLTRKQRAAALALLVAAAWMRSCWSTRLVGVFVCALAVRCNLKPAEVAAIRQHAQPLTMSVKKRAARLSLAASDFAQRTLGNKIHFR